MPGTPVGKGEYRIGCLGDARASLMMQAPNRTRLSASLPRITYEAVDQAIQGGLSHKPSSALMGALVLDHTLLAGRR